MMFKHRWLLTATVAIAFAGIGAWFAWERYTPAPITEGASRLLYGLTLPDHASTPFALSQLRGKTVVLNFWATWCPPCVEEMPELAILHQQISPRNGTVIGIGIDLYPNIKQFAAKYAIPYPLLVAGLGGSELSKTFGNEVGALPFTVIISPEGQVEYRKLGRVRLPELSARVEDVLRNAEKQARK